MTQVRCVNMSKRSVTPAGAAAGETLGTGFEVAGFPGVLSLQGRRREATGCSVGRDVALWAEPRVWGAPGEYREFGWLPFLPARDFQHSIQKKLLESKCVGRLCVHG